MKKIIYLILVLFFSSSLSAQWVQCSGYNGGSVTALIKHNNNIFAGTSDSGIFRSTNNGLNFYKIALETQAIPAFATLGNNIYAGTFFNGVYYSTNDGLTWNQTSLNNKLVHSLAVSGTNIFAGTGQDGVYISTNNGLSWTQTSLNDKSVYSLTICSNIIVAGTSSFGVYLSSNNGINWTQTAFNGQTIESLTSFGNYIFVGTYDFNGVYRSTNSGNNWNQTSLNNKSIWALTTIGTNIVAGVYNSGVYLSTNTGISWTTINQGITGYLTINTLFNAGDYIFAGIANTFVWRRPLSEIIGIQTISSEIPTSFLLSQNYPNPFNPSTTIKFDIPKSSNVKISVFDIIGKEVETLVNEKLDAGTYQTEWNGMNYSSGVYFYKIITDGYVETKRMMLLK